MPLSLRQAMFQQQIADNVDVGGVGVLNTMTLQPLLTPLPGLDGCPMSLNDLPQATTNVRVERVVQVRLAR